MEQWGTGQRLARAPLAGKTKEESKVQALKFRQAISISASVTDTELDWTDRERRGEFCDIATPYIRMAM